MRSLGNRFATLLVLAMGIGAAIPAAAVTYVDTGAILLGAAGSAIRPAVAWGDYDSDGDLDLVVAGTPDGTPGAARTRLYRNEGGIFVTVPTLLPNLGNAALAWGDLDRDGDLDLAVTGIDSSGVRMSRVYRNDGGATFTDIAAGLTALAAGSVVWGDIDDDGDLDLAICGTSNGSGTGATTKVYRNQSGLFLDASTGITPGGHLGALAFADMDGDRDLDLVVDGLNIASTAMASVFRNDSGSWTPLATSLVGTASGPAMAVGDYDADGDVDLAITGTIPGSGVIGSIRIYANNGAGTFTALVTSLTGVESSAVCWGDVDGDGDLDLLVSGSDSGANRVTYVARNDGGDVFTQTSVGVVGINEPSLALGDYDNDGRLDIAIAGRQTASARITKIYRNTDALVNAAPSAPGAPLASSTNGTPAFSAVTFLWTTPGDDRTPGDGLTYELRVGTTPGGAEITGSAASLATGFRRVPRSGNAGASEYRTLLLPAGVYYWSVQAVDAGLRGGAFTAEQTVTVVRYSNIVAPLQSLAFGTMRAALAWGDYDSDGDLDLLLSSSTTGEIAGSVTRLHRNDGASFASLATSLPDVGDASFAWGDYDRDGDLDVALQGMTPASERILRVYRNDAGLFVDIAAGMTGIFRGSLAWADVDGDGDLDLGVCGTTATTEAGATTRVYRNDAGVFVNASTGLTPGGFFGQLAFGDIDRDGDPDLVVVGQNTAGSPTASLFRNDGGTWVPLASGLAGVGTLSAVAFGDFDADGDLDLALAGVIAAAPPNNRVLLYSNNGSGSFTPLGASLIGVNNAALAWGDQDGDGDLDLLVSGIDSSTNPICYLARNDGGGAFQPVALTGVVSVARAGAALVDFNNDGALDLSLVGYPTSALYSAAGAAANTSPTAPSGLTVVNRPAGTRLKWNLATDAKTPQNGLSYDVRIGITSQGGQIVSLPADSASGLRRVARFGALQSDSVVITGLTPGHYFYAVQAVDAGLRGGPLATGSFDVTPLFADAGASLLGVGSRPGLAWGDYDGDGALDLVLSGGTAGSFASARTRLYRNISGVLTTVPTNLPNVLYGRLAWGDVDRDGDLDLALTGIDSTGLNLSRVYRNDGAGSFVDINAGLPALGFGAVAWADFDRDGDLDLTLCGTPDGSTANGRTQILRNDSGVFVDIAAPLLGVVQGAFAWGDVDGDGDLDLVVTGDSSLPPYGPATQLYRNDAGSFTPLVTGLTNTTSGAVALGDYDNDGDLDLAMSGSNTTRIFANPGNGLFGAASVNLAGCFDSALSWGDFDGDGDLDLAFAGLSVGSQITRIARNDGGNVFTTLDLGLTGISQGALAFGDYDRDGRLDLALTGARGGSTIAKVYRGVNAAVNQAPNAPTGLSSTQSGLRTVLHWTRPSDSRTPMLGLSHDVRIGASPNGNQLVSLPADSLSGLRTVARLGSVQGDSAAFVLPGGLLYFTVQAVDAGLMGSALPAWQTITTGVLDVDDALPPPVALAIRGVSPNPVVRSTRVMFDLPRESDIDLSVFDVSGRHVATLLRARFAAGRQAAEWSGRGDDGSRLPAGVYLLRLSAEGRSQTRRVVLSN